MHGDQPGWSRRDLHHLRPRLQVQPAGDRFPPRLVAEHPAEQFHLAPGRAAGAEDELGGRGLVRPLPAEVPGDPQRGPGVGQRGVRGEAVEDDRVAGLVAGGSPAALGRRQRARRPGRAEVTAGLHGQAPDPDRDLHQRDPAGQHVLDAGHPVVVVDVPAARAGVRSFGVDGAQYFRRVGERPGAEHAPDHRPQRGEVGDAVEHGARRGLTERRIAERVHRVDRARLDRGYGPVIDPPAGPQHGQYRLPGHPDLVGRQQAAEEQVPIVG
jgi:hypothetical protein